MATSKKTLIAGGGLAVVVFISVLLGGRMERGSVVQDGKIERLIVQMTIEEKIGQLLMVRVIEGIDGMPSDETRRLIQDYRIGSVLFFGTANPQFTAEYTNRVQRWASKTRLGIPILVGVDFEFGARMNVAEGVTPLPQQMGIGATYDPQLAYQAAAITARETRAMGIHWNFAPVADLNSNPGNPVIGVRSFGSDPEMVSQMVALAVKGYQKNRVIATAKHFPGHGDTKVDSHYDLPKLPFGRAVLDDHLIPFQAAIAAGVDTIMTAHIIVEIIDPDYPATLSSAVLTGLLRDHLGFDGLIVTDAMNMNAIASHFDVGRAAVMAVRAGADVVMSAGESEDLVAMQQALLQAVQAGQIGEERIEASVRRVLGLKLRYGLFEEVAYYVDAAQAAEIGGNDEHIEQAVEIARRSITLLRNEEGLLPLSANLNRVLIVGVRDTVFALAEEVKTRFAGIEVESYRTTASRSLNNWTPSNRNIRMAEHLAQAAELVIALTFSDQEISEGQVRLIEALRKVGAPLIVIAQGLPYDIVAFPEVSTYLATYTYNRWEAPQPAHMIVTAAVVDIIFGRFNPTGKLPVGIPGLFPIAYGRSYH